ncbi:MFS transporter, partial [Burkholderia sp.]
MKQKSQAWFTVFLLFLVYGINYLDRVALSIVAPIVQTDLGIDAAQMGLVFSTFFIGYALFNFIGGLASDRLGPKLVYVLSVGLWSVFCGMTALTVGFVSLLIVRLLFGMAEGPLCSAANKMVNNWLPRDAAATAMGLLSAGSPLGGAIAGPIVGLLAAQFGWRPAFWIVCAIGLAWVVVWMMSTTDRPAAPANDASNALRAPAATLAASTTADAATPSHTLAHYVRQPRILATAAAFFSYNYVLFFFLSWFPSYLVRAHHLNIKEMSVATVVPWLVGTVGLACGGAISDGLYRLTGNLLL